MQHPTEAFKKMFICQRFMFQGIVIVRLGSGAAVDVKTPVTPIGLKALKCILAI